MTRKEALRRVKGYLTDIIPAEDYSEVEEIMKALEQEPCEDVPGINDENIYKCSCGYGWDKSKVFRHHFCPNCGKPVDGSNKTELKPREDCISRQAVLKIYDEWFNSCNIADKKESPKAQINALPPVTPQPEIGWWTPAQRDKDIDINCSVCGSTRIRGYASGYAVDELDLDEVNGLLSKIKYCEHCGTKMQGVKKNEISE